MADKTDMVEMMGLMFFVVVALALTPTVITYTTAAQYGNQAIDIGNVDPSAANTTTLTYGIVANDSTNLPITITLNVTDSNGNTTLTQDVDFVLTNVGTRAGGNAVITYSTLNKSVAYEPTITYSYTIGVAEYTLVGLLPLFFVIIIIAATVVIVVYKLKHMH